MTATVVATVPCVSTLPSSVEHELTYWIKRSRLIQYVCVWSGVTAAETPSALQQTGSTAARGYPHVFPREALHHMFFSCGVKQHHVARRVEEMLARLLSDPRGCDPESSTGPVALLDSLLLVAPSPVTGHGRQSPVTLAGLEVERRRQSAQPRKDLYLPSRRSLWVTFVQWNWAVGTALGTELCAQMASLRLLRRWGVTSAQWRGDGRSPVVVFLGGTSGAGKSTVAHRVASQLHISHVLSTDTVRQALRTRLRGCEAVYPALFVSTYEAHKALKGSARSGITAAGAVNSPSTSSPNRDDSCPVAEADIVRGYEAQCKPVLRVLDEMLMRFVIRGESVVVEGVHLLPRYMAAKYETFLAARVACFPVVVRIPKARKHLQRLCARGRGLAVHSPNRYVNAFHAIRVIQHFVTTDMSEASRVPVRVLTSKTVDHFFSVVHRTLLETVGEDGTERSEN